MPSLRSLAVFVVSAFALTLPAATGAQADAGNSPAGQSAVGAYLDLGGAHGCALQRDRVVRCWGKGSSGRLGGGLADRLSAPGAPDASSIMLGEATAVTAGDAHTCALLVGGAVRCWGQGGSGQLGTGGRDNRGDGAVDPLSGTDDASNVPLGSPAIAISAGGEFTCALLSAGTVRCWGDGRFGVLGSRGTDARLDGLADGPTDDASTVPLAGAATAISSGPQHACALLAGGAVSCWGNGADGRLGSGAVDDRLDGVGAADEASVVPLTEPATAISVGGAHSCALLSSGAVSCWGSAAYGQVGAGRTDSRLDGVISGTGAGATDAASLVPIKPIGTPANRLAATPSVRATAIAAGGEHTCAVVDGGDVRCWGRGASGQLGHSAVDHRLDQSATSVADTATRVGGGPSPTVAAPGPGLGAPAIGLTASYGATCAELANGSVRCWGDGSDGRLGSRAADARLDGVIDPSTGADDASVVPIGALPSVSGDLLTEQAPAPAAATGGDSPPAPAASTAPTPKPPVAAALSFKFSLKGRRATVAALLQPTKAGTCPRRVTATVTEGKKKLGAARLKTTKKGAYCRASGRVTLKRSARKGKTLTLALKAKGVRSRTLQPTR